MRKSTLLSVAVLVAIGCREEPRKAVCVADDAAAEEEPSAVTAHVAASRSTVFTERALLDALVARRFALRVDPNDQRFEPAIRELLRLSCTPERAASLSTMAIDDIFPADQLLKANMAGCGILYLRDDATIKGKGVTWD